jgi:hypothetical protein
VFWVEWHFATEKCLALESRLVNGRWLGMGGGECVPTERHLAIEIEPLSDLGQQQPSWT